MLQAPTTLTQLSKIPFWTFGWDRLDRYRAEQQSFTVPTAKQRHGDFSELLALGNQYQIYDPATIAPASGGRFSRKPFDRNIIPPSRLDPMARYLAASNQDRSYPADRALHRAVNRNERI